ncbi:hypothetical protein EDD15DRAFT_2147194, partial [Pisolithus albus]
PMKSPTSEQSNSTHLAAHLLLLNKKSIDVQKANTTKNTKPESWDDIAVMFEFKKGNSKTQDHKDMSDNYDDWQMIWSLHHMAFGVTIENTKMRFWFSCRAIMLMSEPINFI